MKIFRNLFRKGSGASAYASNLVCLEDSKGRLLYSERECDISKEILIGRGKKCNWRLDDHSVSEEHAIIWRRQNELILTDMGSKNHTKNAKGKEIQEVTMKSGDVFYIAGNKLSLRSRHSAYMIIYRNDAGKVVKKKLEQERTVVGRSHHSDIRLTDNSVSHTHFSLRIHHDGSCWIMDEHSRYGTLIDGERLEAGRERLLKTGERIQVGAYGLLFEDINAPHGTNPLVSAVMSLGVASLLFCVCWVVYQFYQNKMEPSQITYIEMAIKYKRQGDYANALRILERGRIAPSTAESERRIVNMTRLINAIQETKAAWEEIQNALRTENYAKAASKLNEYLDDRYKEAWTDVKGCEKNAEADEDEGMPSADGTRVADDSLEKHPADEMVEGTSSSEAVADGMSTMTERDKAVMALECLKVYKASAITMANKNLDIQACKLHKEAIELLLRKLECIFSREDDYMTPLVEKIRQGSDALRLAICLEQKLTDTIALLGAEQPDYQTILDELGKLGKEAEGKTREKATHFLSMVNGVKEANDSTERLVEKFYELDFDGVAAFRNVWPEGMNTNEDLVRLKKSIEGKAAAIQREAVIFSVQYNILKQYGIDKGTEYQEVEDFLDEKKLKDLYSFDWMWQLRRPLSRRREEPICVCDKLLDLHNFMEFLCKLKQNPLVRPPRNNHRFSPSINRCYELFEVAEKGLEFMDKAENRDKLKGKVAELYKHCQKLVDKRQRIIERQLSRDDKPGSREFLISRGIAVYLTPDKQNGSLRKELIDAYARNVEIIQGLYAQYDSHGLKDEKAYRDLRRKILETGFPVDDKLGRAWGNYFDFELYQQKDEH